MEYIRYVYDRINWLNKSESMTTPLGKTNLNRMDSAIYYIAENLDIVHTEMSVDKFDRADADKVIVGMPTWDRDTGIFTLRFYDGTTFQMDFNVEKIPVSFSMDSAGVITMVTEDGTEWTADIGDVMTTYTYVDSDTVAFSDTKDGDRGHIISAEVKKNSITGDHLQPDYLKDMTKQASDAKASADLAKDYADNAEYDAKMAQSYAIGIGEMREGERTDSAKYYKEKAEQAAETAEDYLSNLQSVQVTGVKGSAETSYRKGSVNITPANIGLGNVGNYKSVSTVASQGLSDTEKSNARANIGAGTSSFSGNYEDLNNKPTIPASVAVKGNAETSYRTGNVNLTPDDLGVLPKAGGAMTGNIAYKGTKATYDMIKFIDNPNDAYGNGIAIGGGGAALIGSGESVNLLTNVANNVISNGGSEVTAIAGDGTIDFYTNCNSGFSSAKKITMNKDGSIAAEGFNGNASSATKLSTARTVKAKLDSTESASFDGSADITPGVTGTLPVANGGTGKKTFTSGKVLIGNGTGAISERAIDTTDGGTAGSTSLITSGAVNAGLSYSTIYTSNKSSLSVSAVFSTAKEIIVQAYNNSYMYSWNINPDIIIGSAIHLVSGYKTGNYEGVCEVAIDRNTAQIVSFVVGNTNYTTGLLLKISYR